MSENETREINEIIAEMNLPYGNLEDMEKDWQDFVGQIIKYGYDDYLVEFDNDACVRDNIEAALRNNSLHKYQKFQEFKKEIERIDVELKKCFVHNSERTDMQMWWNRGIVKNGSADYINDLTKLGFL